MSEKRDALYTRESHPHTGDPRFDPAARARRSSSSETSINQGTLDSLINPISPRRKLQRETWYTAKPGTEYRSSAVGTEPGSPVIGRIDQRTKIKVVGKRVRSGIASVQAEFTQDGKTAKGWFRLDDIRTKKT